MSHLSPERLAALADDRPTADEAAHLGTCGVCARERAAFVALAELGRAAPTIAEPLTRWETLAPALRSEGLMAPTAARWAQPRSGWALAAAAVVLVALGGAIGRVSAGAPLLAFQHGGDSTNDAPSASTTFASVEEAERARVRGEQLADAAAGYLSIHDTRSPSTTPQTLRARLNALATIRGANRMAPGDPVVTSYMRTADAQYEATIRQLNTALPASLRMTVY